MGFDDEKKPADEGVTENRSHRGNISSEKMERRGCLDRVSAATWPLCQERLWIGWKWRVTELDGPSTSHAADPTPDKARTGLT